MTCRMIGRNGRMFTYEFTPEEQEFHWRTASGKHAICSSDLPIYYFTY